MAQNHLPKNAVDLLYLVSCAVNNQEPDKNRCSKINIEDVFQLAQNHSLTTCAAEALEQIMPLPRYIHENKSRIIGRQVMYEIEREKTFKALEENGIWYVPLKGVIIKEYYPKPTMREMSDNDILFDSSRAEDLKHIMESLGFLCEDFKNSHHDEYTKRPHIIFEMHRTLFNIKTREDFYEYFKNIENRLIKCKSNNFEYRLSDEDFYIFLICHLYKHYNMSGTGLRSLLDVYIFNRKKYDSLNIAYLEREFNKLKLIEFEKYIREFSKKIFTLQELSKDEENLLLFFIESNCHGTLMNKLAINLGNNDSKNSKIHYAFKRIFPDSEYLKNHYPVIYRYRILYPFLIIYRVFSCLAKKPRTITNEIKALKGFKNKDTFKDFTE